MQPKISNSIFDDLASSSLLYISLMGVRTILERDLDLKDLILASEDSAIKELQRRSSFDNGNTVPYPYSYLSLSELTAVKDTTPGKNVKRHGWRMGTEGATRATSKKGYLFPVLVQISLHYLDSDPIRVLRMAEALVILTQIGPLVFSMSIGDGSELEVRVEVPDGATIPVAETENTHAPDAQEIEVPLVIHTWVGFFRDVSAVNSDRPIATVNLKPNYLPTGE